MAREEKVRCPPHRTSSRRIEISPGGTEVRTVHVLLTLPAARIARKTDEYRPWDGRADWRTGRMNTAATMAPAPQHMRALARANEVRLARAELKRRIAQGELPVADVVLSSPWEAESMTISDLLTSQRRWGTTRCRKLLQCIPMSENKTVGSMTDRQRNALAALLSPDAAKTMTAADIGVGLPFAFGVA